MVGKRGTAWLGKHVNNVLYQVPYVNTVFNVKHICCCHFKLGAV